ncbi:MAG: rRNA pseudouridine synthase [Proteobacteria bacterium]|nr:rRNA pseudouridine synthase [Pseudomonadota bacterium]
MPQPKPAQRLAKRIAAAGLCSRRGAEVLIKQGRVKLDGITTTDCATNVTAAQEVMVDGVVLSPMARPRLWCYHKPRGLIVSHKDDQGRPTIFASLEESHPHLPRLISVGRLDLDSEGLMLLTNNGDLARYLELPSTGWVRKYRLRVRAKQAKATPLTEVCQQLGAGEGITIDGIKYRPITASIDTPHKKTGGSNVWLTIALVEGKNREIRRVMAHFGYAVSRLLRLSFGPFHLGKLNTGEITEVQATRLKTHLPASLLSANDTKSNRHAYQR